jgi:hypothetical protein
MKAAIALTSLWLKEIGATWVGAKMLVIVAAAAVPAATTPAAATASPARVDTLGKRGRRRKPDAL